MLATIHGQPKTLTVSAGRVPKATEAFRRSLAAQKPLAAHGVRSFRRHHALAGPARPLAGHAARVNLVTVRVHVESIDLALSIKAKGDEHAKFLCMERVLPMCSKNVVVHSVRAWQSHRRRIGVATNQPRATP